LRVAASDVTGGNGRGPAGSSVSHTGFVSRTEASVVCKDFSFIVAMSCSLRLERRGLAAGIASLELSHLRAAHTTPQPTVLKHEIAGASGDADRALGASAPDPVQVSRPFGSAPKAAPVSTAVARLLSRRQALRARRARRRLYRGMPRGPSRHHPKEQDRLAGAGAVIAVCRGAIASGRRGAGLAGRRQLHGGVGAPVDRQGQQASKPLWSRTRKSVGIVTRPAGARIT
jgi:hypothetical protein